MKTPFQLDVSSPQVTVYRNHTQLLSGTWQADKLLLAFERNTGIKGEVLFKLNPVQKDFLLEGSGDLSIGRTNICNCQVILEPQGILLRKYVELIPGRMIDMQFTPEGREFTWLGEAIFSEELRSALIKSIQVVTRFYFSLPQNDAEVSCKAEMLLPELNIKVSMQEWLEEISDASLNSCFQQLRESLVGVLMEEVLYNEMKFADIQLDCVEEIVHPRPVTQRPDTMANGYLKNGYLQTKKATATKGYLNGYLQKKTERKPMPAPTLTKRKSITPDYAEVEKYATRILYLKEVLHDLRDHHSISR